MRTIGLAIAFVILGITPGLAQLASGPKADELLVESLLTLDELSASYCARFSGSYSVVRGDLSSVSDIYGICAKSLKQKASYSAWGIFHIEGPNVSGDTMWLEALRVGIDKRRFKIANEKSIELVGSVPNVETQEALAKRPDATWTGPELDPFGLVFGYEGMIGKKGSAFENVRSRYLGLNFESATVAQNGNVIGVWFSSQKLASYTVEFGRDVENLPVRVHFERRDKDTAAHLQTLGLAKTEWKKVGDNLLPKKIVIMSERKPKQTPAEIEFNWEWIPVDKWQANPIDLAELLDEIKVMDMRKPFMALFEESQGQSATQSP